MRRKKRGSRRGCRLDEIRERKSLANGTVAFWERPWGGGDGFCHVHDTID